MSARQNVFGLWLGGLFFVSWSSATAETIESAAKTKVAATAGDVACPSQIFSQFLEAFSEDVRVQKRFTRFPLEYRYLDAHLIGSEKEDDAEKKRMIKSFEMIPFRSKKLFPNRIERKKRRLETKLVSPENGKTSSDDQHLLLFNPNAGERTHYRFNRDKTCWYLYLIEDRST